MRSGTLDVSIPVKTYGTGAKVGSLVLESYTTLYTGEKDNDTLMPIGLP